LEQTPEREEIIERIAALDIGKAELVCCVRVPCGQGRSNRAQEVKTYRTMTRSLLVMVERLRELGVRRGDRGPDRPFRLSGGPPG
jgi:transposase